MGSRSVQDAELQRALRVAFGKPMCYGEILQRGQAAAMQTRSEYTRAPNRQQAQYRNSILRDQREQLDNEDEGEGALLQWAQSGDNPDDRLSGEDNNTARKQQLGMYSVDLSAALGGSRSRRSSVAGGQPVAFPDDACKSSPNLALSGGGIRINFSGSNTSDFASCLSPTQASQQGSSMLLRLPSGGSGAQSYRRSTTGGTGGTLLQGSSAAGPLRPSITGAGSPSSAQPSPRPSSSSLMSSPSGPLAPDSIFSDRSGPTSCVGPATLAFASTPMRPRGLSYSGTGAMPRVSSFQAARRPELLLHQLLVNKEAKAAAAAAAQAEAEADEQPAPLFVRSPSSAAYGAYSAFAPLRSRSTDFASHQSPQGVAQPQPPQGRLAPLGARSNPRLKLQGLGQDSGPGQEHGQRQLQSPNSPGPVLMTEAGI